MTDIVQKSTLESSLERAKRAGASEHEAKLIYEVVEANTTPDIRGFDVTYGRDSDDDLAVWVDLFVDENLPTSREKIAELNRATTTIRSKLLNARVSLWPYVVVRSSS